MSSGPLPKLFKLSKSCVVGYNLLEGDPAFCYLGDSKVEPDINNDKDKQEVEGTDHQQWFLKQTQLLEVVV